MDVGAWHKLPYPVFNRIIAFLPTLDVLNVAKVCFDWKLSAAQFLQHIKIDDSTAYGGSFFEYNKRLPGRPMKLLQFVKDLTQCTDDIKYIDIDVENITGECVEKLLMTQRAIKSLTMRVRDRLPNDSCIDELVRGIVKHESTLEKLNIGIDGYFIRFEDIVKGLEYKESCFDNLKSVEFLSTSAGFNGVQHGINEFPPSLEEKESAIEVFKKIFRNAKIEELNFRAKLPLAPIHYEPNVYWSPIFIKMLMGYFESGNFSTLRKINVDSLNTGGLYWDFSNTEAELLIKHCPSLTHIDFDVSLYGRNEYHIPKYDEKCIIKLVEHYGTQIVFFNSPIMSSSIAKCIHENCPDLRSITIFNKYDIELQDEDLMLLADLCHLRTVKLMFEHVHMKPETIIRFLEKVIGKLTKLKIAFGESIDIDYNILHVVSQYGSNLRKLHLEFEAKYTDTELERMMNGFHAILQSCDNLQSLSFISTNDPRTRHELSKEKLNDYLEMIVEALITKHKKLKFARLYWERELMTEDCKEKLVNGLPFCRFEFDYDFMD